MMDSVKKKIGKFSDGATLYKVKVRGGCWIYIIEDVSGFERYCTNVEPGEPSGMVNHYTDITGERFCGNIGEDWE